MVVPGNITSTRTLSSERNKLRDPSIERKRDSSGNQDWRRPDSA